MQEKRRADEELDNKIDNFLTVLDRIRRHDASATSPSSPSSPASSGRWSPKSPNTAKSPAASLRAPAGGVARAAAGGAAKDASQTLRQGTKDWLLKRRAGGCGQGLSESCRFYCPVPRQRDVSPAYHAK